MNYFQIIEFQVLFHTKLKVIYNKKMKIKLQKHKLNVLRIGISLFLELMGNSGLDGIL
jgi:hypothetical protein